MQKIVREQEYFKEITQDQIEKKLRFLERAIGEGRSRSRSGQGRSDSSPESMSESAGARDSEASPANALEGPIYDRKGEEMSAQFYSDENSLHSGQEDEDQEGHAAGDSKESPSPSKQKPTEQLELSPSVC